MEAEDINYGIFHDETWYIYLILFRLHTRCLL
jgi:hypothetical protein